MMKIKIPTLFKPVVSNKKSLLILLLIGMTAPVLAQEKTKEKQKKKTRVYELKVGLSSFYDDNILKYSDKYLTRFMNNEDFGRFHIDTYDDVVIKPSLQLAGTYRIFKKKRTRFNFSTNYNAYVINEVKNWAFYSAGIQQSFAKRAIARFAYTYIPEFYVRHFRDQDLVRVYGYTPETFVPFSFSKDNYAFWVQNTFLKNTRIRLTFDYMIYYHNKYYTEYDCKNYKYGIFMGQPLNKKVNLQFGFAYTQSNPKGYDEPFETKESSDDADASFESDDYSLELSWQLPDFKKRKHNLNAGIGYSNRYYTTEKSAIEDAEHSGRVDDVLGLSAPYSVGLSKSFDLSLFYNFNLRDSWTTSDINSNYVSNEKDYLQNQVGFQLIYSLKF
jgi:hypothetical protein